ncbi:MAG TPA: hypothetical protein VFZ94_21110 [Burkholderiales bacterium]|jgi:hypothetical protein|nr:hypothetical protein [Burkholderiales bacterium]
MRDSIIYLVLTGGAITAADISGLFTYARAAEVAACIARNIDFQHLSVLSICY